MAMVSALISRCLILVLGTLYPAYRSYKAIKNKDLREYVKWMMYWIVFALFTTMETFLDIFFSWFPFYYEIKILFIIWVLSPATRGSSLLYKKVVHPMLTSREKEIDDLIEKTKQQGYSTFLHVFTQGFQYVSNFFLLSAVKGQSMLGNQIKKSLSLNDVNFELNGGGQPQAQPYDTRRQPAPIDEDDEYDPDVFNHEPVKRTMKTSASGSLRGASSRKTSMPPMLNGAATANATNGNGINYSVGYEFVDDGILISDDAGDLDSKQKSAAKRRTSARQLTTTSSTNGVPPGLNGVPNNYRSNEASHYGTLTRGKASKSKGSSSSISTAQAQAMIYDHNDL